MPAIHNSKIAYDRRLIVETFSVCTTKHRQKQTNYVKKDAICLERLQIRNQR